jgi:hypothetical protein
MTRFALRAIFFASSVCVGTAFAQFSDRAGVERVRAQTTNGEPLVVTLERKKVVVVAGQETLALAEVAKPGDLLLEVASYTNKTKKALAGFQATLPVPQNTELLEGTVQPASALASVDGKNFAPMPLKRTVKLSNGIEVEQLVPVSEIRYLRWSKGEIGAETTLRFSAKFRVSQG